MAFFKKLKTNIWAVLLIALAGLAIGLAVNSQQAFATNPNMINFQGKVVNANGTNVADGSYSFRLRLYTSTNLDAGNACSANSCIWETTRTLTVTSGVFQVELGDTGQGDPALPDFNANSTVYLGIKFNGDSSGSFSGEMSPRIHLDSVPYALNSDKLGGLSSSSFAQLSSTNTGSLGLTLGLTIGSGQAVTVGSTAGSSIGACTGSQVVTGFQTLGGIVVAGSCSAQIGGGGSLATAYNSSGTTGNTIALSNSGAGIIIQDAASSTITNLFAIQNNGGTSTYLAVTAANSGSIIVGSAANKLTIASGSITTASGNLQVYGAGTTTIGNGTGAINLTAGTGAAVNITALANSTWQVQGTSLTLDTQSSSNSTLTVTNSGAGNITLALEASGIYAVGSSNGTSIGACSAGQTVSSFQSVGGIVVAGACNSTTTALNNITAATAANTPITNGDYKQTWQWSLTSTANDGLLINESAASTATGSPSLVQIDTLASSTAIPLSINNVGAASAFLVQDNSVNSLSVLASGTVQIGSATTDSTQVLFQLDSFSTYADTASCTTTTNQGAMYYNTNTNAIRVCLNGAWEDMISTAGLGIMLFGVVPDSGSNPGDLLAQSSPAHTTGPCKVSWVQNAGASQSAAVSVAPCVAYSGGRKVVVASPTTVTLDGSVASQWEHLCFTTTGTLPTTLAAGTSTETNTANNPNASYLTTHEGSPILCLADIQMTSATGTTAKVNNIYDVRTFTTTVKEYATSAAAMALGVPAIQSGVNVTNTTTTVAGGQEGVVVATDMSTSTTAPNVILAVAGPTFAKSTAGTAGAIVIPAGVASRLLTTAIATTAVAYYEKYGVARTTFPATACSTTANATNCDAAMYFVQSRN